MKRITIINLLLLVFALGMVSCKKDKKENKNTNVQFYNLKRTFNSLINTDFTETKTPAKNCIVYVYKLDEAPVLTDSDIKVVTDTDRYATGMTDDNGVFSLSYETSTKSSGTSYYLFKVFNDSMETFSGGGDSPWIYQSKSSDDDPKANSDLYLYPKLRPLKFTLLDASNNPLSNYEIVIFPTLADYNESFQGSFSMVSYKYYFPINYYFNSSRSRDLSFYGITNSSGVLTLKDVNTLSEYWFRVYTSGGSSISTDIIKTSKLYPLASNEYIIHSN